MTDRRLLHTSVHVQTDCGQHLKVMAMSDCSQFVIQISFVIWIQSFTFRLEHAPIETKRSFPGPYEITLDMMFLLTSDIVVL